MKERDDYDGDMYDSDMISLTHMMDLGFEDSELWEPAELGAILEHQLAAPVLEELAHLDKKRADRLEMAVDPPSKRFADLLHHPRPPVEVLNLTKQFAKACRKCADGPLPEEIATILYFLSIAAAITKCGRRITRMDDQSLRHSLDWTLKLAWLDSSSRGLLRKGREAVEP